MPAPETWRVCKNGHNYLKSSDCPVCPVCEAERKPQDNFLSLLAAPARRALEGKGITTAEQLAAYTQNEILQLHGMGPGALSILNRALEARKLTFKNK